MGHAVGAHQLGSSTMSHSMGWLTATYSWPPFVALMFMMQLGCIYCMWEDT